MANLRNCGAHADARDLGCRTLAWLAGFTLKAFWSTGCGFAFDGAIQITINGKAKSAGKNVAALSQHPNENEILFPPGTKFNVTEREDGKDGIVHVILKEV